MIRLQLTDDQADDLDLALTFTIDDLSRQIGECLKCSSKPGQICAEHQRYDVIIGRLRTMRGHLNAKRGEEPASDTDMVRGFDDSLYDEGGFGQRRLD